MTNDYNGTQAAAQGSGPKIQGYGSGYETAPMKPDSREGTLMRLAEQIGSGLLDLNAQITLLHKRLSPVMVDAGPEAHSGSKSSGLASVPQAQSVMQGVLQGHLANIADLSLRLRLLDRDLTV